MKRLILLRHAKSSWSSGERDIDRPLNKRGAKDAPVMASQLFRLKLIPDLILCSPAKRTRETCDLIVRKFKPSPKVTVREGLYLAAPRDILSAIQKANIEHDTIMVIGHNPGMEVLATSLASPEHSDRNALCQLSMKFPTCALASFEFSGDDWSGVDVQSGALTHFLTPKEIKKSDLRAFH